MHICTVATLCFPEKTFPRNYYYCVQDENSLCLCFKNMYRTLFVAIFTSTFIFSMYDHIGLPGCVFPYLSKYKYQQSYFHISIVIFHHRRIVNKVKIILCPHTAMWFWSTLERRFASLHSASSSRMAKR